MSLAVLLVLGALAVRSVDARLKQLSHNTNSILAERHAEPDAEQERALVTRLEQENADWLYDAKGNTTKEGEAVRHYIAEARRLGIKGAQARWEYATAMVERDLLRDVVERNRSQADSKQSEGQSRTAGPAQP
jgi:hypothetical protein